MRWILAASTLALALVFAGAAAAGPRVAADIPPTHALVARVMAGVGAPDLIVPPGASPHGYAMRPSEARALERADAVFWTSRRLTPWLEGAVDALAAGAARVELAGAPGVRLLPLRENATFAAQGHADADHGGDSESAGYDEHFWLDPENAKACLDAIAATLARIDPANAGAYLANARAGRAELDALIAEVDATVAPVRGRPYVVFHDAYQYFEVRFAAPAAAAISLGDAVRPGAARIAAVHALLAELGPTCVFTEPQFPPRVARTVAEGTGARIAALDPLGAALTPGPGLYPALIRNLGRDLAACLGD